MRIKVKLFALYREKAGASELWLELPESASVRQALDKLGEEAPALQGLLNRALIAVSKRYVKPENKLQEGDELAVFPPVSGGNGKKFEVTQAPISVDEVVNRVNRPSVGGIVTFVGVVRGESRGRKVLYLEYEAYPEMAEETLAQIGDEIREKWPQVDDIAIVHRTGKLEVGEVSVVIAVAGAHRQGLFDAARYAIDRIKEIAPIWKKEVWEGGEEWVEENASG
ncbi:MAG TPA: molybdopterin converting factor [Chloroflexi bacterium]|nr:molybdopterin converting factor [Chloroflexota bacterium]